MNVERRPLFEGLDDLAAAPPEPKPVDLALIDKVARDQDFPSREPRREGEGNVAQVSLTQPTVAQDSAAQPKVSRGRALQVKPTKSEPEFTEVKPIAKMYGARARLSAYVEPELFAEVHAIAAQEDRSESYIVAQLVREGIKAVKARKDRKGGSE
jgi:hypothetical protein